MAQTTNQQRAAHAVAARMARLEWNNTQLVAATGADPGTIGDFLNGKRWPKIGTQGKIERALEWPRRARQPEAVPHPAYEGEGRLRHQPSGLPVRLRLRRHATGD